MAEKIDLIPEEMTIAEASAFGDTHSVADYPSHKVEFEYVPGSPMSVVTIAAELADVLQRRAVENGVSV